MSISELGAPPSHQSSSQVSVPGSFPRWRIGILLLILLGAFLPRLLGLAHELWSRPQYQFFPLVLLGAVFLARERLRDFGDFRPGPFFLVLPVVAVSWVLLGFAGLLNSYWLAGVSGLIGLAGGILAFGGFALFWRLAPVWLYLWLAMPLPLGQDNLLVRALQPITTEASSRLLDLIGVPHVREGNLVTIPGKRLFVDESCSGIHSLYSGLACTAFLAVWLRRGVIHTFLLLVGAVGCVVAANVGRVTLIAYLEAHWQLPVSEGWPHELAGWLAFAVALTLIASTEGLLLFLLGCGPVETYGEDLRPAVQPPEFRQPPTIHETALTSWPVVTAFGAMAFFQMGAWWFDRAAPMLPTPTSLGEELLPERSGPWQRTGFEVVNRERLHELGASSQIWRFQGQGDKLLVSLDYPFSAWHDVVYCYKSQGWVPVGPNQTAAGGFRTKTQLAAAGGRRGYLWFGAFDANGRDQPIKTMGVRLRDRLDDWNLLAQHGERKRVQLPVYQVQLLVESYHQLSAEEERRAEELFLEACQRLKSKLAPSAENAP
jgi:exosortase